MRQQPYRGWGIVGGPWICTAMRQALAGAVWSGRRLRSGEKFTHRRVRRCVSGRSARPTKWCAEAHPTKSGGCALSLRTMQSIISGKAYVLGDNIDTDQIIPAQYLSLNPSMAEERKFFGMYAN